MTIKKALTILKVGEIRENKFHFWDMQYIAAGLGISSKLIQETFQEVNNFKAETYYELKKKKVVSTAGPAHLKMAHLILGIAKSL